MNKEELKRALKKIIKNPTAMIGFVLLIFFIIIAILAPILAPPNIPIDRNLANIEIMLEDDEKENRNQIIDLFRDYLDNEYMFVFMDHNEVLQLETKISKYKNNEIDFEEFHSFAQDLADYYIIQQYYVDELLEDERAGIRGLERTIRRQKERYEEGRKLEKNINKLEELEDNYFEREVNKLFNDTYKSYVKSIEFDPYIMRRVTQRNRPEPPSEEHRFGISGGRDIYYGVIWGTRTGFKIGLIVVGISTIVGLIIGSISAYFGGWVDEILMRITDIFLSIPFFLGAMVITTVLGTGLDKVMISMTVLGWMITARLIRGNILQAKNEQYVLAAKALGVKDYKIIILHILPNTIFPVVIQSSMRIGSLVITAAALSFLGLGAPQGYADWGSLLSYARDWMAPEFWYIIVFPGVSMILFVLSWNLVGDALRDIFDPKMKM